MMDFLGVNKFSKFVSPPPRTTTIGENDQTVTFTQTTVSWSTAWSNTYSANRVTNVTQVPPAPLTSLTPLTPVVTSMVPAGEVESSLLDNFIFSAPAPSAENMCFNLSSFDANENTTDYFSFMDPSEQLNQMGFNSDEEAPSNMKTGEELGFPLQPQTAQCQVPLQCQVPVQSTAPPMPAQLGSLGVGQPTEPQNPAQDYHEPEPEPEAPLQTQATEHNGSHTPVTAKKSLPQAGPAEPLEQILGHVCEDCGKSYSKPNKLKEHKISHNPLSCQYCNLKYKSYSALRSHVTSIHDNAKFICLTCGKIFRSSENMKKHQKKNVCHKELNEKPVQCGECEKKFKNKKCLSVHRKNKHNNDEEED
jgi:hypothetical protein